MSTVAILMLVVLVVLAISAAPHWGYSRGWGYAPSSMVVLMIVVAVILIMAGKIG